MAMNALLILLILIPVCSNLFCLLISSPKKIFRVPIFSSLVTFVISIIWAKILLYSKTYNTFLLLDSNIIIDKLSLYHIFLVNVIFFVSSIYASGYFNLKIDKKEIGLSYVKRYCLLWQMFHSILLLVLVSNNIGIMWIALEATTLVSAFLIISESNNLSIEAMWKYLIICSVGIVFAFMGTILTISAARKIGDYHSIYLLSELIKYPNLIEPQIMFFAFIMITVGYGTKAGLSPMHTWLPDAHSMAPTPVSAVFSGVMLNCALFCIMRYLPIVEAVSGYNGWAHSILILFGILSLAFAMIFIPFQFDLKRFLAYCSVEHIGIIALGIGIGGIGTFAALLHTLNHSLAKTISFFSAGYVGETYHTMDMRKIRASLSKVPLWGKTLFISFLILIGVAPFGIFYSELLLVKEIFYLKKFILGGFFLFATVTIFIGAVKNILISSLGSYQQEISLVKPRNIDKFIAIVFLSILLAIGLWLPYSLETFIKDAASIVENGIKI